MNRIRLFIWGLVGFILLLVVVCLTWVRSGKVRPSTVPQRLIIESLGRPMLSAFSLSDVARLDSFNATVQSKRVDTNSVTIYLRKADGKELAIYETNLTVNVLSIFSGLKEGIEYRFPEDLFGTAP